MAKLVPVRICEMLGGPWDGAAVPVVEGQDVIAITDGATLHLYERDELFEGPRVRQVFRETKVLPLPRREKTNG